VASGTLLRRARRSVALGVLVLSACRPAVPAPPAGPPSPTPPPLPTLDPGQVARGREVYGRSCASCHGPDAQGAPAWQQPDARGDLPPPPHDDSGHTWRHSDAQLAEIIRDGLRDPFNKTPESTMPPFRQQLDDQEIDDVLAYFKSLWSPAHRRFQDEQNRRAPMPLPSPSVAGGR
jgi:mono/diheme cytochrome c family protein